MRFEYHNEYLKDVKRLDGSWREPLLLKLKKISENPEAGKPMEYSPGVFSERVLSKRVIYEVKDDVITLVCFKNRDEVYKYMRKLY